ncbi:hypothetical protein CD799_33505 [Pseudomonas aeruginosa]|nr:hypothetical protein CD799_33505 [Pseudomonas aeruginosa]
MALPDQELSQARETAPAWDYAALPVDELNALLATRDGVLDRARGRGGDIDEKTAHKVWTDAGGRCMFDGCAEDLSEIPYWNKTGRVGYLAHIIASDPKGPRGSQMDSHRLSNAPENIMLMCDAHHRLIDTFAPSDYPAEVLYEMRRSHRDTVRRYLNSMAFPRSHALTLHANLANVPTYFQDSDFIEAILASRKSMAPGVLHYIRRTSHRDDRNQQGFWGNYLREHEGEIRRLIAAFNSTPDGTTDSFSVFPLHHTATMVLAGRIMGEAQGIQVFQYDRNRRSWAWNAASSHLVPESIQVSGLILQRTNEALITVELTASIDESSIPADLGSRIRYGGLPWIRITTPVPRPDLISTPQDLEQFAHVARRVINHVQDAMRVERVHLIVISPASTVFRFGQMLQAGHHPEYIVYDRAGREYPFVPALSITGHAVSAPDNTQNVSISLR